VPKRVLNAVMMQLGKKERAIIKVFHLQKQWGENTLKYKFFNVHILKSLEPFGCSADFLSPGYVSLVLRARLMLGVLSM